MVKRKTVLLIWGNVMIIFIENYFRRTHFREQKVSRFSRILAQFAKVYVFKNSRLSDSRKFMLAKKIKNKIFFQDLKYFQVLYPSKQKHLNINKFKLNLI